MSDRYTPRSGADYAEAFARLLPTGPAWPRDPQSVLMLTIAGLADIWGTKVDARAGDLLVDESDPRSTVELLSDWERAFGLPDKCLAEPLSIRDRQIALVLRITAQGGQSREFFQAMALAIGYTITIKEYAPFMVGVSRVGDTTEGGTDYRWRIGPPEMRFAWVVQIGEVRLTYFRVGASGGQTGIDPLVRIALATDLECMIRRYKPAHTDVYFDYSLLSGNLDFSNADNAQYHPALL